MTHTGRLRLIDDSESRRSPLSGDSATTASTLFPVPADDPLGMDRTAIEAMVRRLIDERLRERGNVEFTSFGSTLDEIGPRDADLSRVLADLLRIAQRAAEAAELEERLKEIMDFKQRVDQAIEIARGAGLRSLRHGLVLAKHAAHNTYAEDMSDQQLAGLVRAIELLIDHDALEAPVEQVSDCLAAAGLEFVLAIPQE